MKLVGYTHAKYGFDYETCGVLVSIKEQSKDIAQGVDRSLELREGMSREAELERGAGDQGMMVGFACVETPELMPLPISLAHRLCRRLAEVRKDGTLHYLRPDGKSQVTVEYAYGVPKRIEAVVIAAQHDAVVKQERLHGDIMEEVIRKVLPAELLDGNTKYFINATGRFEIGGPMGDAGLTGRKIIVDTYGGIARHGGGCFSGKDPTKVDRSGAYAARYVAKNLVAAGLADRLELHVSYAIGVSHPTSLSVEAFGTNRVPESRDDGAGAGALRPAAGGDHPRSGAAASDLPADGVLRALRAGGHRRAVGEDGQGGGAAQGGGPDGGGGRGGAGGPARPRALRFDRF